LLAIIMILTERTSPLYDAVGVALLGPGVLWLMGAVRGAGLGVCEGGVGVGDGGVGSGGPWLAVAGAGAGGGVGGGLVGGRGGGGGWGWRCVVGVRWGLCLWVVRGGVGWGGGVRWCLRCGGIGFSAGLRSRLCGCGGVLGMLVRGMCRWFVGSGCSGCGGCWC